MNVKDKGLIVISGCFSLVFLYQNFHKEQHHKKILQVFINKTNLKPDNLIVDICTPKEEFCKIVNEAIGLKIKWNIDLEIILCIMIYKIL